MERLTKVMQCDDGNKLYDFSNKVVRENKDYSSRIQLLFEKLAQYEDAEEQGLLVKVECHCKDCVHWSDMVAGATEHVKLCSIGGYMVGKNGYCVYAEQKLAEMKGE